LRLEASPVKRFALAHGLNLWQPADLRGADVRARLRATGADATIVAAYGLIVPADVLEVVGTPLNIHASLLPRWRGAAPIQRARLAGDAETGVSIMKMESGLDTGPVLARRAVAIASDEDAGTLHDKLADAGAVLMNEVLARLDDALARAEPQDDARATYAAKIQKKETLLSWTEPAARLERMVRAFRPTPGAQTGAGQETLKIWRARVAEGRGKPGTVLFAGEEIVVACGEQALAITELQRAGGRRLSAAAFLAGHPLIAGSRLGTQG
jgi:methionyl-tRNA formyltransferase